MPISVGAKVTIKWRWEGFSGITRYCRNDEGEYVLGIQRFTKDPLYTTSPRTDSFQGTATSNIRPRSMIENQIEPRRQESNLIGNPKSNPNRGDTPTVSWPFAPDGVLERAVGRRTDFKNYPRPSRPQEFDAPKGTESLAEQPSPDKERTRMSTKWLDSALGRQKQDAPNGNTNGASAPVIHPPMVIAPAKKIHTNDGGKNTVKSQGDLQSTEDIYRAAGIMNPRMGYSINKVVEMLNSDFIRGLATDAKRAAILMALDAAGVSFDDVLRDATLRQEALDQYETEQLKHFEEYWARKIESNAQIQSEMDRVSAQYQDRINQNLEEVTQEKVAFTRWQTMKGQEAERMSEAVGLCSKTAAAEPANASVLALREVDSIVKS